MIEVNLNNQITTVIPKPDTNIVVPNQTTTEVTVTTAGATGKSGTSGTSGISGTSSSSGTSGLNGSIGTSGTSGITINTTLFATTGSNTFIGNQTISGSLYLLENVGAINFGTTNTYVGMGEGALLLRDSTGYIQLDAQNNTNYAQIILAADNEDFLYVTHNTTGNSLKFTTSGSLLLNEVSYDAHLATTGSNTFIGDQTITGSLHITGSGSLNGDNIVSSNTIQKIETISSASYAALTPPVSGTLYIII